MGLQNIKGLNPSITFLSYFLNNSSVPILTSIGSKGLSIILTHLGLNPDWSILDSSISSVTCAMRVCSTTSTVANQRLNASECVFERNIN